MENRNLFVLTFLLIGFLLPTNGSYATNTIHELKLPLVKKNKLPKHRRWVHLGTKWVSKSYDVDNYFLHNFGSLRGLVLLIERAPVHIFELEIFYKNGAVQKVFIDETFRRGEQTQFIKYRGNRRVVDRVKIKYESVGFVNGRVCLLGRI